MRLEEWSWIAAIVAIPLGILIWLVDRKQVIGIFKNWWKGILFLFTVAVFAIAAFRGWFNFLTQPVINWLAHPIVVRVWVTLLIVPFLVLVALLVWFIATSRRKSHLHRRQAMTTNQPVVQTVAQPAEPAEQPEPVRIDWHNYVQDEILGVIWQWRYSSNAINENTLVALCPRTGCMNRLRLETDFANPSFNNNFMAMPVTLTCHRCGFKRHLEYDGETLRSRVCDEIERRVRTGEYEQRMRNNS